MKNRKSPIKKIFGLIVCSLLIFSIKSIASCGSITALRIYNQATDQPVPGISAIYNDQTVDVPISQLPKNYYLVVETQGNILSTRIYINDFFEPADNNAPYTTPSWAENGDSWNGGIGLHDIDITAYKQLYGVEECDYWWLAINIYDDACTNVYYADVDGDGYGNPSQSLTDCSAPSNYVLNNQDCNDNNAAIYPGATEICDGLDNNCNGETEEGLTLNTYYLDNDNDGYGGSSYTIACSQPAGFVSLSGDCNDNNENINPGETEVPGDNIDNNCDGVIAITGYCEAESDVHFFMYIQNVQIGSFNNPSESSRYTDFTSLSIDLNYVGNSFSISPGYHSTPYSMGYAIWIDWNQDSDFDDAGELVFITTQTSINGVYGSFNIPSGALQGTTRMRVIAKYLSNNITPCSNVNYGEVEDYTVIISEASTCTNIFYRDMDNDNYGDPNDIVTDCTAPTGYVSNSGDCNDNNPQINQGASEICDELDNNCNGYADEGVTTAFYIDRDWDGFGDANGQPTYACNAPYGCVDNNQDCNDNNAEINPNATEISGDGIDNNCDGTDGSVAANSNYCAPRSNSFQYEFIRNMKLGSLDKTSQGSKYSDFTDLSTVLTYPSSYTISITPKKITSSDNEGFGVWIDWNQDSDFDDAGEHVLSEVSTAALVSGSIAVPASALEGSTRMRVIMRYGNSAPTNPCASFTYGEVEDYNLEIVKGGAKALDSEMDKLLSKGSPKILTDEDNDLEHLVYPNPVSGDELFLKLAETTVSNYRIYNNLGQIILDGNILNNQHININILEKGIYWLEVKSRLKSDLVKFIRH